MFDIQIRLTVNGRPVAAQKFIDALFQEIAQAVRSETKMPLPALQAPGPLPTSPEVRRTPEAKPLAVGITEAAKLVGVKSLDDQKIHRIRSHQSRSHWATGARSDGSTGEGDDGGVRRNRN